MAGEKRSPEQLYADAEVQISKRELSLTGLKLQAANRVAEALIQSGGTTTDRDVFRFAMVGPGKDLADRLQALEWRYKAARGLPIANFFTHSLQEPDSRELIAIGLVPRAEEGVPPLMYKIERYNAWAADTYDYSESAKVPHYSGKILLPLQQGRRIRDWSDMGAPFKNEESIESLELFGLHRQKATFEGWHGKDSRGSDFLIGWPAIIAARRLGHNQIADTVFMGAVDEFRLEFSEPH